jgi:hypothetical protein
MRFSKALVLVWTLALLLHGFGCAPGTLEEGAELSDKLSARVSAASFLDKVTVGYQGWFVAKGDGSKVGGWAHWSASEPSPGQVRFEVYPDTRDYDPDDLYETGLGALGDGRPAKLFSSYSPRVVDTHFRWMEEVGIDGVGLQRFVSELGDERFLDWRNQVARHVRSASEAHGRIFYIEYDISGANEGSLVDDLKKDWSEVIQGELDLLSSPQYARQDGRPVVYLWGLGFDDRPGTPAQAAALIEWFQAQGCFVAVGVPYEWRSQQGSSKPGFLEAYSHANLIQPWAVGAVASDADIEKHFADLVKKDLAWTKERGIAYQRVVFPGFAWSNWNGGQKNQIPRRAGKFFWKQILAVKKAGAGAWIAMFDEYDEGTAIAKAAESAAHAPASQYFLTLDADGTALSSDFYLRLAGAATRVLHGESPASEAIPIPAFPEAGGPPPTVPPGSDAVPAQSAYAGKSATHSAEGAQGIVLRLYPALLGREADPSGLASYVPMVEAGQLAQVVSAFVTSPEFDARRGSLSAAGFAADLYQKLLDRDGDPGGLDATADAIRKGHVAERVVGMVESDEYRSKNP